jgi:hypothetical protein
LRISPPPPVCAAPSPKPAFEPGKHPCPKCDRLFKKYKDSAMHLKMNRCGSTRGRYAPVFGTDLGHTGGVL